VDGQHLRRVAEAPAHVKGYETGVRVGGYHCVAFIGSVFDGSGHLQTMPGFEIVAGNGYVHQDGLRGKISFDAAQQTIEFNGGALAGKGATYGIDPLNGRSGIHLYNAQRTRTVIDCEGPPR